MYREMEVKESVGKGAMGDYYRAILNGKEVAIKLLINQKIKEDDLLKLMSDSSRMRYFFHLLLFINMIININSKINHPNLLKFYAVCLEQDRILFIIITIL